MSRLTYTLPGHGFGANLHHRANAIAYCEKTGECCYEHTPMNRVAHGQNSESLEEFSGFKSTCTEDQISTLPVRPSEQGGVWSVHENPEAFYTKNTRSKLREMYESTAKPEPHKCDHAIHVRRGDVNAKRYPDRWVDDNQYLETITKIKERDPTGSVCVFSQGKKADFKEYEDAGATLHLNTPLDETFHSFVHAPHLIVGKSSLSWIAGALNENKVSSFSSSYLAPLPGWEKI
tara:strand:- start:3789 stop:4487 length:699 start_codon:yes stop_codon:yes gene_type:complete